MRALILSLAALAASGCASLQSRSPVDGVTTADAHAVASSVAGYVAEVLPPAASTIRLAAPPAGLEASANVEAAVAAALRDRGYAVAEGSEITGHELGVTAMPFDADVIVQLVLDGDRGAQLLRRDAAGSLASPSPMTVQRRQP